MRRHDFHKTLARERDAAEYRESLEACLTAAQQMRRLTESLLHLARSDAGQEQMPRTDLDLAAIAQDAAAFVALHAQKFHIKIYRDLAPAKTLGSADHLRQVVTNLLTNAIEYNKPFGEVRVSTRVENGCAIMTIADNGQGIEENELPHVFDRFYRTDKARSRASGRSGPGYPFAKPSWKPTADGSRHQAGSARARRSPCGFHSDPLTNQTARRLEGSTQIFRNADARS